MQSRSIARTGSAARFTLTLLGCALALLAGSSAFAQDEPAPDPAPDPELEAAVQAYLQDPVANRDQLIEVISESGTEDFSGLALVVVGDAYMRAGDLPTARRYFDRALTETEVVQSPDETGWLGFAHLGMGMVDVSRGNMDGAYESFGLATAENSPVAPMAMLAGAQAAASMGKEQDALDLLAALDELEEVSSPVRDAARFTRGNLLLQKGEYEEAAAIFEALADEAEGNMARDARYAAAQARLAGGDAEAAKGGLRSLVEGCPAEEEPDSRRASRPLRNLEARSVLQAWVENYREAPFGSYMQASDDGSGGFSVDGCTLARVSIEELEPDAPPIAVAQAEAPSAEPAPVASAAPPEPAPSVAPAAPAPATAPATDQAWPWLIFAGAVVVGVVVYALARRRG